LLKDNIRTALLGQILADGKAGLQVPRCYAIGETDFECRGFAVLYLIGAVAFGVALLFYTFSR